ncbi:hypothetical protein HK098_008048 [Nowakowskiella sp. JEL0407]|nr:hypothetical protein HK098_008048 [Nowakowskiella sp. JEL0407]
MSVSYNTIPTETQPLIQPTQITNSTDLESAQHQNQQSREPKHSKIFLIFYLVVFIICAIGSIVCAFIIPFGPFFFWLYLINFFMFSMASYIQAEKLFKKDYINKTVTRDLDGDSEKKDSKLKTIILAVVSVFAAIGSLVCAFLLSFGPFFFWVYIFNFLLFSLGSYVEIEKLVKGLFGLRLILGGGKILV